MSSDNKTALAIKFTYECGCRGEADAGKVSICCPKHGDMLCVNGVPMDMMKIDPAALDCLMEGAPVPAVIDLNRCGN